MLAHRCYPIAACIIAALAVSPFAQTVTDEADLKALGLIKQEATERSQLMETAGYLTDVYGPRLTGSPQLKAAADFILQRLITWKLQNSRYERFGPFGPGWTNDRFVALALAPDAYGLLAYPKAWTPGTPGDVIADAVLAPVETERDFDRYRGKLRGKFVLTMPIQPAPAAPSANRLTYSSEDLQGLATPGTPARSGAVTSQELEFARKRMQFYIEENAAVLVEPGRSSGGTVFVTDGRLRDEAAFLGAGFYPWPDEVAPQVVIAHEQYNRIARTLGRGIQVTLEMNIVNNYLTADPDSFNLVAEIPGIDDRSQVVIIGAHLDSWHAATGATDNAAGCAVVLEALRILSATGLKMRRTVRLVLWAGSEQGLLGSRAYVATHFADAATMTLKPEHAGLSAYFNVDGGTGAIRGLYLEGNEAARPVLARWIAPFAGVGMTALSPRTAPGSDHLSFDAVGLPSFHFIQDPLDYEASTRHSNMDVYDRLQASTLIQNAVIVASLAYRAANANEMMPRKPLPPPNPAWAAPLSPRR
jgi:hypothetical protein